MSEKNKKPLPVFKRPGNKHHNLIETVPLSSID